MDIYKSCPIIENTDYLFRRTSQEDCADLLKVYSDKEAVPFFNSDNCHGDDFCYTTAERMMQAIDFWEFSYKNGYFVRFSIIDKKTGTAVGTIEIFNRTADDHFTNCGLLRLDLVSGYEKQDRIAGILSPIIEPIFQWFGCDKIATKAIPAAKERIKALVSLGFALSQEKLIGEYAEYDNYYVKNLV